MEKKKYLFADDGSYFVAASAAQIVFYMRDTSKMGSQDSLEHYMVGFADRYRIDTGNNVRCDSCDNFVADLQQFGFLAEVATEFNEAFNSDFS
jgi:hypothetical protein